MNVPREPERGEVGRLPYVKKIGMLIVRRGLKKRSGTSSGVQPEKSHSRNFLGAFLPKKYDRR